MILIEKISYRMVRGNHTELIHFSDDLSLPKRLPEGTKACRAAGRIEHVEGVEFIDDRTGRRVTIGLSENALEALEIPWRCIKDQKKDIERLYSELTEVRSYSEALRKQISEYKKQMMDMPFLQRVVFCFNYLFRGGKKMFIEKEEKDATKAV